MATTETVLAIGYEKDGPLGRRWVDADRGRRFRTDAAAHSHIMKIGIMFPNITLMPIAVEWIGKLVGYEYD